MNLGRGRGCKARTILDLEVSLDAAGCSTVSGSLRHFAASGIDGAFCCTEMLWQASVSGLLILNLSVKNCCVLIRLRLCISRSFKGLCQK